MYITFYIEYFDEKEWRGYDSVRATSETDDNVQVARRVCATRNGVALHYTRAVTAVQRDE